jgi:hypothetical protein
MSRSSLKALVAASLLGAVGSSAPGPAEERPAFWRIVERAAEREGVTAELDVVLEHMRGIPARRAGVANRLSRVDRALVEPWTPPALADELRALLAAPADALKGPRFAGLMTGVADWLDVDDYAGADADEAPDVLAELDELWAPVADPAVKGVALLAALGAYVEAAHTALADTLEDLFDEDRDLLFAGHADFAEGWYRSHFPDAPPSPKQQQDVARFRDALLLHPGLDRARLLAVTDALLRLAEPRFLDGLPRRLARARNEAGRALGDDVFAVVGTEPRNRVVLSGRRSTTHATPAALIVDLGGDDRYERAAVVDTPEQLASVVLDLGGDDTYLGATPGPAYAAGGVALLVDREGDDVYESRRLGQAASALGSAVLVDLAGDDTYRAHDYAQGHSLCGLALLVDLAGDDTYAAWAYAQGGGLGYGLSALVDGDGNDRYLADLRWPDVYGNSGPEIYHGASQGYCTGMRPEVAGGIAALLDLGGGEDRYQSGNFSQGGGYYFSFGLLYDGGGDDENFGTRYSQGFGVHQAVGVRWDADGNDSYTCRSVAHTGMAWDEGVGYLLDDGGDDTYRVGDLACGGAAQTGVAVCIDGGGADTYRTGRAGQGTTGGSEYHDKPALGVLLDLGGEPDVYTREGCADGTLQVTAGVGVFLDDAAKDAKRALRSDALR